MNLNLKDRVVIITGAGSGIGLAATKAFLAEGAYVVGADIDISALQSLSQADRVLAVKVDFRRKDDTDRLVEEAIKYFGHVDVLFNNVGIVVAQESFLNVTDEQWLHTLDLNVLGYVRTARAVLPHMLARGKGLLLHTASEAARMPNAMLPEYSVSKSAVLMLSKVLAAEFTSKGIRSNAISPACIRTAIFDKPGGLADTLANEFGVGREEALQRFVERMGIPVGRLGTPEEVASLAVYLASDFAQYISGANFAIDGGVTPVI